jgi:hypothetical protein
MEIPLSFEHKELISQACARLQIPLSEYNFANLFLFRHVHAYRLLEVSPAQFAIVGRSYRKTVYFMPLFKPENVDACLAMAKSANCDEIFPIPEMWFDELQQQDVPFVTSDDDNDYLYSTESIRSFKGRHYDGQRNAIRQFLSDHKVQPTQLTDQTVPAALHIINEWMGSKYADDRDHEFRLETLACQEGVQHAAELGLEGWIYEVDTTPVGILLGGPLTKTIYMFHFAKALTGYRGLSAYMFQHAASVVNSSYTLLNWQQDLGLETLRQAKHAYHPTAIAKKGRLLVTDVVSS